MSLGDRWLNMYISVDVHYVSNSNMTPSPTLADDTLKSNNKEANKCSTPQLIRLITTQQLH